MIYIPNSIKKLIKKDGTYKRLRIIFQDPELTLMDDIELESLSLVESISSSNEFRFGGSELSVIEFTAHNVPDVQDKIFTADLIILCGDKEVNGSVYSQQFEQYVYSIDIGTYRVKTCKSLENTRSQAKKIVAYTENTIPEYVIAQFEECERNEEEKISLIDTYFLESIDHGSRRTTYEPIPNNSELSFAYYSHGITIGDDVYELRYQIGHNPDVTYAMKQGLVYEPTGTNYIDKLNDVYDALDEMFGYAGIHDARYIQIAKNGVKSALERMQHMTYGHRPMYYFAYPVNNSYLYGFPFHYLVWLSITPTLFKNKNEIYRIAVPFGSGSFLKVNIDTKSKYVPYTLKLPKKGSYESFVHDFRKSAYELIGRISKARANFRPDVIEGYGLQPHDGLHPHNGLYPSSGGQETYESGLIKKLYMNDFIRKYGSITLNWVDHIGENQTASWNMAYDPYDYHNVQLFDIGYSIKEDSNTIIIQFDSALFNNVMYLELIVNKTLEIDDYMIVEAYKRGERIFEITRQRKNVSGFKDKESNFDDHRFESDPNSWDGKIINDGLIGVDSLVIKTGKNIRLVESDINVVSLKGYEYPDNIEYSTGETYSIATDNLILAEAGLDSYSTFFYISMLDEQLRNVQYSQIVSDIKGLPYVEPGDKIEIHTKNVNCETIITRRKLKGIQSLTDSIQAD